LSTNYQSFLHYFRQSVTERCQLCDW